MEIIILKYNMRPEDRSIIDPFREHVHRKLKFLQKEGISLEIKKFRETKSYLIIY